MRAGLLWAGVFAAGAPVLFTASVVAYDEALGTEPHYRNLLELFGDVLPAVQALGPEPVALPQSRAWRADVVECVRAFPGWQVRFEEGDGLQVYHLGRRETCGPLFLSRGHPNGHVGAQILGREVTVLDDWSELTAQRD